MKALHINVNGKVQGVGFRYFCQRLAIRYSILGTVKNLPNGHVEIIAQGAIDSVDLFLSEILKGNKFIIIENYTVSNLDFNSALKKFKISY